VKTTGHSLGSALTTLTTMMLIKNGVEIKSSITFGQPRIGDSKFAAFTNNILSN